MLGLSEALRLPVPRFFDPCDLFCVTSAFFVGVDATLRCRYISLMLTPEQSRAARGWLDWSQDDLAKRANVSLSTVRDFEKGRRVPIANNLEAIRKALEGEGIFCLTDEVGKATGIRFYGTPVAGS